MSIFEPFKGAAAVARELQMLSLVQPWTLRWKPVCSSTETVLSSWLRENPLLDHSPRALIAKRQTHGIGQWNRAWKSPVGGVWVSAAFPLTTTHKNASLLGLAVAVAMSESLEAHCVPVCIKWPNDLMIGQKKLAGLLPRISHRGKIMTMGRIGIGLNVCNRVPIEGISLKEVMRPNRCNLTKWTAEVILALDRALDLVSKGDELRVEVERRLWDQVFEDSKTGEKWDIEGIEINGALKVRRGSFKKVLTSRQDPF